MATPSKLVTIAESAWMSAKWDEVCEGRDFGPADVLTLTILVQWYAVLERCFSDMDVGEGLPQVAYENNMGDIKALPFIDTMKKASAEIRQLNKQLGIVDGEDVDGAKHDRTHVGWYLTLEGWSGAHGGGTMRSIGC